MFSHHFDVLKTLPLFTFAQPPIHKIKGDTLDISVDNTDFLHSYVHVFKGNRQGSWHDITIQKVNHLNMQKREMRMTWELTYHQYHYLTMILGHLLYRGVYFIR